MRNALIVEPIPQLGMRSEHSVRFLLPSTFPWLFGCKFNRNSFNGFCADGIMDSISSISSPPASFRDVSHPVNCIFETAFYPHFTWTSMCCRPVVGSKMRKQARLAASLTRVAVIVPWLLTLFGSLLCCTATIWYCTQKMNYEPRVPTGLYYFSIHLLPFYWPCQKFVGTVKTLSNSQKLPKTAHPSNPSVAETESFLLIITCSAKELRYYSGRKLNSRCHVGRYITHQHAPKRELCIY